MTRRTAIAGATIAVAGAAPTTVWLMGRDSAPVAFDLEHASDLRVWIGSGRTFPLEVRRGARVLERHDRLTSDSLLSLRSAHVTVRTASAPVRA
ncbi:hypothetical protein [Nocardioides sp.]|uniref:hypothetical protein n=1 Tax=Nocardioides sp. TaxID=35761 RepID=UPI0035633ABC